MRKLFKLALFAGVIVGIGKLATTMKEWQGLSEAQVRDRLDTKLAGKVDDPGKRTEIADKVVSKMRERGMLREDAPAVTGDGNGGVTAASTDEPATD
jgi:hypothetical protein